MQHDRLWIRFMEVGRTNPSAVRYDRIVDVCEHGDAGTFELTYDAGVRGSKTLLGRDLSQAFGALSRIDRGDYPIGKAFQARGFLEARIFRGSDAEMNVQQFRRACRFSRIATDAFACFTPCFKGRDEGTLLTMLGQQASHASPLLTADTLEVCRQMEGLGHSFVNVGVMPQLLRPV